MFSLSCLVSFNITAVFAGRYSQEHYTICEFAACMDFLSVKILKYLNIFLFLLLETSVLAMLSSRCFRNILDSSQSQLYMGRPQSLLPLCRKHRLILA